VAAVVADDLTMLEAAPEPPPRPAGGLPGGGQADTPNQPELSNDMPPDMGKATARKPQVPGTSKMAMPATMVKTPQPASNGGRAK